MKTTIRCAAMALLCASSALAGSGQLVAVDSNRTLYDIDMLTGAKTQIGVVSANAGTTGGLARDSVSGAIYLTSTSLDSVYTLDLATGNATLIGAYGDTTVVMHGLEYADGMLYGASGGNLYNISTATGLATLIGNSGLTSFTNLGFNSDTAVMYATNSGTDSCYTMNLATGATTLLGALGQPTNPHGLAYNTDNQLMYLVCSSTDNLYTIDPVSGAATLIGSTGSGNLLGLVYIPSTSKPCPANIVTKGASATQVDVDDLLAVITEWGPCPAPPAACPANIVNTGSSVDRVDVDDLLAVITGWGPCP